MEQLDARSLLQAAPVCKLWASVYKSALHQLDVSCASGRQYEAAAWLRKNGQDLHDLCYTARLGPHGSLDGAMTIFLAVLNLTQLRSLGLHNLNLYFTGTQRLRAFQSLTSLSLSECYLKDGDLAPMSPLSSLRRLSFSNCYGFDLASDGFASLGKGLAQLTSLTLSALPTDGASGLSELQQLQQLNMSSVLILISSLPLMPSLTKLTWRNNPVDLDAASETALSKLQDLDLNHGYFIRENRGLSALVSLTRLEAVPGLQVGPNRMRSDRCVLLTVIGPLQQLHHLRICSDFKQTDPISSFSILATLQHLTHLELTGPTLPAGALAAVFRAKEASACFPKLQCLSIMCEDGMWEWPAWQAAGACISSDELEQLVLGCPQLQSLTFIDHPIEAAGLSCLAAGLFWPSWTYWLDSGWRQYR